MKVNIEPMRVRQQGEEWQVVQGVGGRNLCLKNSVYRMDPDTLMSLEHAEKKVFYSMGWFPMEIMYI